jgi:hypothetical protein
VYRTIKRDLQPLRWDLASREGKPVERAEVLHGDAKDFPALIEKLKQSPMFQALQNASQKPVENIVGPLPEAQ